MALSPTRLPGARKRRAPSRKALLAVAPVAILTALAAGAGTLWGLRVIGTVESTVMKRMEAATPDLAVNAQMTGTLVLKKLAPIVTNLAAPANTWVRLEAALLMEQKAAATADPLIGAITEDILGFLRSVTAQQMEGAAGLRNLREDLLERVAIRSKGLVRDIVIETLVVQ
ncbi:flagellar basal body-associated FliL family protein [Bosea sp. 124]|uniref:flagellar basal body-associated FliL family protein n=1 Tax=Bosea sp. 124 TaxID=2135642 RepID=UPI000D355225|nr:flagellar basal body-associated FliL family protein [Bosea sp. 124]PTM40692.1 flagellar FliL protein [Bosea sp. 124]